jgi:hypothetical protein
VTRDPLPTAQKAFQVNLDRTRYGTIAEIGGGQEVAGWFFRVGGAAGTVAKSISAYDMTVSDGLYGRTPRYVSQARLRQMLDHEYRSLLDTLGRTRGETTAFFAFADTVATRSFSRPGDGTGWLGSRFQHRPGAEPSQIILHVRLLDPETVLQQEALGLLGVNLIHATTFLHDDVDALVTSLGDHLSRDRVELDFVDVSGPAFARADPRELMLLLLGRELARAVMFAPDGRPVEPSATLRRKSLFVLPGVFRPVLGADLDVLASAAEQLAGGSDNHLALAQVGSADAGDLLGRIDTLAAVGLPTLVTDIAEPYALANYFGRYTTVGFVFLTSADVFADVFREKRFEALDGGVFEALGRLFKRWVRVAIYPTRDHGSGDPLGARVLASAPEYRHLFRHLVDGGWIREVKMANPPELALAPAEILDDLRRGGAAWEALVPAAAASVIKTHHLFGYCGPSARMENP